MSTLLYKHYAHGKLLLSGEYFVLDGAKAFAIPTHYGQLFKVYQVVDTGQPNIVWKSLDHQNKIWLEVHFNLKNNSLETVFTSDKSLGKKLEQMLNVAIKRTDQELELPLEIYTYLEFPTNWG